MKRSLPVLLVVAFAALLTGGCRSSYDNNYLRPEDFATYLKKAGIKVTHVRPLPGEPFRATSGAGILIDNSEIGVYKYDKTSDFQRKRLEKIEKTRRIHIAGIPYPVKVYGSFMFFGLEKNKHKRAILETIKSFK